MVTGRNCTGSDDQSVGNYPAENLKRLSSRVTVHAAVTKRGAAQETLEIPDRPCATLMFQANPSIRSKLQGKIGITNLAFTVQSEIKRGV